MSQFDFGNLESPLTGTNFINSQLEPWRDALHSHHSGASRPSYAVAGMMWIDTTTSPWVLKMFNGTATDITLGRIHPTNNWFEPAGSIKWAGSSAGTANALTLTPTIPLAAYAAGVAYEFLVTNTNTAVAPTLEVSGLAAQTIKASMGAGKVNLPVGALQSGMIARVVHDGTDFLLINTRAYNKGADIATASTLNLNSATGDYVRLTGTTTVTGITLAEGLERTCVCAGAFILTDGSGNSPQGIICPGAANITTAAGDVFVVRGEASGTVRVVAYTRANGQAIVSGTQTGMPINFAQNTNNTSDSTSTAIPYDNTIPQQTEGKEHITVTITPKEAASLLLVEGFVPVVDADGSRVLNLALFRDSTTNCINNTTHTTAGANYTAQMYVRAIVAASSTAATTFKLRYGPASGTMYVLRNGSGNLFGGAAVSSLTVTEIKQ